MRLHMIATSISAVLVSCVATGTAHGVIIIDDLVESSNSWTSTAPTPFDSTQFGNPPGTFITPTFQEGTETAVFNGAGGTIAKSGGFPAHTLQAGTYTIEFAVGNYNNTAGSVIADVDFTGLNLASASSSSIPQPASGGWSLWSITWEVDVSNPNLGDPLSFSFVTGGGTTNGPFDGVGNLSGNGTGFLVDFVGTPEPSAVLLTAWALIGLALRRSRRGHPS